MKQTFVKAAVMACFMAAVSCGQAPTAMGPAEDVYKRQRMHIIRVLTSRSP